MKNNNIITIHATKIDTFIWSAPFCDLLEKQDLRKVTKISPDYANYCAEIIIHYFAENGNLNLDVLCGIKGFGRREFVMSEPIVFDQDKEQILIDTVATIAPRFNWVDMLKDFDKWDNE